MICNSVLAQKYINTDMPFQDSVSSSMFTESENEFLNKAFHISEKIDFNDKKVCFLSGNGVPYRIISKECFLNQYKGIGVLYVFNESQKKEANGYDIAISVFTKKMPLIEEMPRYIQNAENRISFPEILKSSAQNGDLRKTDNLGVDYSPLLNEYESDYFNEVFKDSLNEFNFSGKKIGFIYGGAKSDKKEYFDLEKKRFKNGETPNSGTLYVFDEVQKEESGGYDAVIAYWCKLYYSKEQIIKKLIVGYSSVSAQYADMKIYKSFVKGGTTASVFREFHEFTYSDSTHVNINGLDSDMNHVFNNAKCSKLVSQKHAGISCGAEINKKGQKHYIFVCMPNRIYDMTDGLIYTITDTTDLQKMSLLFRIVPVPNEILDCLPGMGGDTSSILNTCEAIYLDSLFLGKNSYINEGFVRDSFAFEKKKVAFLNAKEDIVQITKKAFFYKEKYALNLTKRLPLGYELFIFTKEEAKQVGYDAVIISGNGNSISKKEVMKKLRKKRLVRH